jgi:soluble lytic murein transglycosylase
MSSMHKNTVAFAVLLASAGTVAAALKTSPPPTPLPAAVQSASAAAAAQTQAAVPPAPAIGSRVSTGLARWNSLRQSDNLPFASYASFLTSYRGWPGETSMRKTAERAIDPNNMRAADVVSYFRVMPPLTGVGQARYAFALNATGQTEAARNAAREAWQSGVLPQSDIDRLLALFGSSLTMDDHDRRMETLLANSDMASARRLLPMTSPARRPVYEARIALQSGMPDVDARVAALGDLANTHAGVLRDRAERMRNNNQGYAARALLARSRTLAFRPHDVEKWYETLLVMARGAANDRQWQMAYQIASQIDDAYAPGTDISAQSYGERDDYTSLAWLAGTVAFQRLNRHADAEAMFVRYAKGGRSAQVLTKGMYWAGRAAQAQGQMVEAQSYFGKAAAYPELFYGQLALEQLNRPVPAPRPLTAIPITAAERTAFHGKDLVQAVRLLGQLGSHDDQTDFVRALSEQSANDKERALAAELARQVGRNDLSVWLARDARNDGSDFYVRAAYPEVQIPPSQSHLWSLAHGIMRQESSFDRAAVSHAGARGMMQLMPATARETSSRMGLSYDQARLTTDPGYNVMLGSHYFARLMDQWNGYAPLAIASYNAGAGNVRRWINENGDPRTPSVDVVTWIEQIPFTETRGYVQRVLENAVVYDALNPARANTQRSTRLSYYLGKNRPG